ncbi:hypothetical protein ABNG30_29495 [Bacillus thuringiensis]
MDGSDLNEIDIGVWDSISIILAVDFGDIHTTTNSKHENNQMV